MKIPRQNKTTTDPQNQNQRRLPSRNCHQLHDFLSQCTSTWVFGYLYHWGIQDVTHTHSRHSRIRSKELEKFHVGANWQTGERHAEPYGDTERGSGKREGALQEYKRNWFDGRGKLFQKKPHSLTHTHTHTHTHKHTHSHMERRFTSWQLKCPGFFVRSCCWNKETKCGIEASSFFFEQHKIEE